MTGREAWIMVSSLLLSAKGFFFLDGSYLGPGVGFHGFFDAVMTVHGMMRAMT